MNCRHVQVQTSICQVITIICCIRMLFSIWNSTIFVIWLLCCVIFSFRLFDSMHFYASLSTITSTRRKMEIFELVRMKMENEKNAFCKYLLYCYKKNTIRVYTYNNECCKLYIHIHKHNHTSPNTLVTSTKHENQTHMHIHRIYLCNFAASNGFRIVRAPALPPYSSSSSLPLSALSANQVV